MNGMPGEQNYRTVAHEYTTSQLSKCIGKLDQRTIKLESAVTRLEKVVERRIDGGVTSTPTSGGGGLQARINQIEAAFNTTSGGLQARVTEMEGLLQEKADRMQLSSFTQTIEGTAEQIASIEQTFKSQVDGIRQEVAQSADRMQMLEGGVDILKIRMEDLQKSLGAKVDSSKVNRALEHFKEKISQNLKARDADCEDLRGFISMCEHKVAQALKEKVGSSEFCELKTIIGRITESKADAAKVQQLHQKTIEQVHAFISEREKAWSTCTSQVRTTEQKTAALKEEVARLEKGSALELRQLRESVEQAQHRTSTLAHMLQASSLHCNDVQKFADALKSYQAEISDLQFALRGKVDTAAMHEMTTDVSKVHSEQRGIHANLQAIAESVDELIKFKTGQALQLNAVTADCDRMKTTISSLQSEYLLVQKSFGESFQGRGLGMADLGTAITDSQAQITGMKDKIDGKADLFSVQQVARDVSALDASFQDLHNAVSRDYGQVKQLESKVATIGSTVQSSQEECRAWCSQRMDELLAGVRSQMESMQQARNNAYSACSAPGTARSGHLSNQMKATHDEAEDSVSRKVESLEGALRSGTDRIHQLEGAMRNIWNTFDSLKGSGANAPQAAAIDFHSGVERVEGYVARLEKEVHQKASKAEIKQLSEMIINEKQIAELERSAQSSPGTEVALQNRKIESIERALQQGTSELRRVEESVAGLQSNVRSIQSRCSTSLGESQLKEITSQLRQECLGQVERVESGSDQKIQSLEAAMREAFETTGGNEAGMVKSLEITVDNLKAHVKEFEQSIASKVEAADLSHLKSVVSGLQAQMTSFGQFAQQDTAKMDSVQQFKGAILNVQSQMNSIKETLHEKAGMEQVQKIKGSIAGVQSHLVALDQSVQEKASTEQVHQLNTAMSGLHSKVSSLEQHKADSSNLQQLNDNFNMWQSRVPTTERVQQLEATVTSLGQHVTRMENKHGSSLSELHKSGGFADVHTQVELQHFKGIIAGMEKKITDLEQDLHDKISRAELQQTRRQIMGVDTKVVEVEQMLQEKASMAQVQSLQGSLQTNISSVEQAVHEKLDVSQLQPLKASIATVQAQTANVEQSLHDKVCINQMQQLKGTIASTQAKVQSIDQAMLDKAETGQMQQLKDAVAQVQGKISMTVTEAVATQMKQLCQHPSEQSSMGQRFKRLRSLAQ